MRVHVVQTGGLTDRHAHKRSRETDRQAEGNRKAILRRGEDIAEGQMRTHAYHFFLHKMKP